MPAVIIEATLPGFAPFGAWRILCETMRLSPPLILGGTLILFLVAGAFLIFHNLGGGGSPVSLGVSVTNAAAADPPRLAARQGDMITLNVTSDRIGDIHLHGYDIHFQPRPGEVASQTFRADKSGDFDIEWESTHTHLADLVVYP
jgi:hypothetical protein